MTEQQIVDAARVMRRKRWSWAYISHCLGVDKEWLKRKLGEPNGRGKRGISAERRVAIDAAARKAEIPEDRRDLTGRIFGDPLFERSALYRKMQSGASA
jgi:hypothetical protein